MKTHNEIIIIAKKQFTCEGWPWREPVWVTRFKKHILWGKIFWRVITNSEMKGSNGIIIIDDKTGDILKKNYIKRLFLPSLTGK